MKDKAARLPTGWPLLAAVACVGLAAAPTAAQDSETLPSRPAPDLGGFRLPPANDGRTPGVQGPSDNGLPPAGPTDRRPAPVQPPVVIPTQQPSAGDTRRSADRPAASAPADRSLTRTSTEQGERPDNAPTAAPESFSAPASDATDSVTTPAADSATEAMPPLSPITGRVLPGANESAVPSPMIWAALVALVLLLGGGYLWRRWRHPVAASSGSEWTPAAAQRPAPAPSPPIARKPAQPKADPQSALLLNRPDQGARALVTRPAAELRPDLAMALEIIQLAMTPTHLSVRFALHLANRGTAAATGALARIAMQQAATGQDVQLQSFFDGAGGSVVRDDIEIPAGASQTISGEAQLPRERIQPLMIADKPMLVPVLAFDVTYHWDGPADAFGQVAGAFVVGRETAENNSKLGPLRLDQRAYVVTPAGARATAMQRKV